MDRRVSVALAGSAAASAAVAESAADLVTPSGLAWRWIVRPHALELYAVSDPGDADRRLTLISGGGALHRARIALEAEGLAPRVTLLPDADPDHLATVVAEGPIAITADARARFDATEGPQPPDMPPGVAGGRLASSPDVAGLARDLVAAATAEGVRVSVRQEADELIAVLYGEDTPDAWLRAGEAMSAIRVEAARHGLTAVPTVAGRERPDPAPAPGASPAPGAPPAAGDRRRDLRSVPYVHLRIA